MTSPRIAKLGWAEEVFYRRMHSVVDDFGRYYADVGMLRAACYPRQLNKVSDSDVGKWLRACVDAALVRVYQVDGEDYLLLSDFNQQVRAKKSKFPEVPSSCAADAQQLPANAHLDVSVSEDVSEDDSASKRSLTPDGVSDAVWQDYLKTRKAKMTETALSGLRREAGKAGMSLEAALTMACERGWRGFKAEWVTGKDAPNRHYETAEESAKKIAKTLEGTKPPSSEIRQKLAELRKAA